VPKLAPLRGRFFCACILAVLWQAVKHVFQMSLDRNTIEEMATNPVIPVRLRPVIVAYLDELARVGSFGKGRSGMMRRFIEDGITRQIERRIIGKRDAFDFGERPEDDEDET
jgi:hypothetical protein